MHMINDQGIEVFVFGSNDYNKYVKVRSLHLLLQKRNPQIWHQENIDSELIFDSDHNKMV